MSADTYDVAVVGATRAGIAAAKEAQRRGLKVCLLDPDPTTRAHESHSLDLRRRTGFLQAALGGEDSVLVRRRAAQEIWREIASCSRKGLILNSPRPLSNIGVSLLSGSAHFVSPSRIELASGIAIQAGTVVIATGSRPRRPERFSFDGRTTFDSHSFLRVPQPPRSVVIVGADWSGCEWAYVCCSVGSKVTLIDRRARLLRALDADIRLAVQGGLHEMGVDIVLEEELVSVGEGPHGGCCICLSSGRAEVADSLLVLAGTVGNTCGLGLAELGVQLEPLGHVFVDESFQSSVEGIFAIGEVSDPTGLAPSGLRQASIAIAAAMGEKPVDQPEVPWVLHSSIEVGMCGLTAEVCAKLDIAVDVGLATSTNWSHHAPRLAKAVVARTDGRILGAQIAGPGASEAIHVASDSVHRNRSLEECAQLSCSERTMTELYWAALRSAQDQRQGYLHKKTGGASQ